jgi:hypothetical protein
MKIIKKNCPTAKRVRNSLVLQAFPRARLKIISRPKSMEFAAEKFRKSSESPLRKNKITPVNVYHPPVATFRFFLMENRNFKFFLNSASYFESTE